MIRSLAMLGTFILLGLICAIVFIPWAAITGNVTPLYNAAQWVTRMGLRVAGVAVEVEGRELVPAQTACIFMANHVSNLDPPALIPQIPGRTSAFMKRSMMNVPILNIGFRMGDFIPVDRGGNARTAQQSVSAAAKVLAGGVHITTFVEGTRSPDGRLLPFKKGPFFLAQETGAPCVPVSIWGTETMMAKGSFWLHPGTAEVRFHKPVLPGECADREEMMAEVRVRIAGALPEWMRG